MKSLFRMGTVLFLFIIYVSSFANVQPSVHILYVSPSGNDACSGQLATANEQKTDGPLATLQMAQTKVRQWVAKGLQQPVHVIIREGTYRLYKPLVFEPQDSGTLHCPITWKAFPGEQVIITGGQPLSGWQKVDGSVEGLLDKARPHVWVTDVAKGERFFTLFDEQGILPRARSPRMETSEKEQGVDKETLRYQPGQLDQVNNFHDAELFIIPKHPWITNFLPIKAVDRENRIIKTTVPGTYDLITHGGWSIINAWYTVENVLEFLDKPGEWVLDTQSGKLYLWLRTGDKPQNIVKPGLRELFQIQGDIENRNFVEHLHIQGLTFKHAERMSWHEGRLGVQHDWEVFGQGWSALYMRGGQYNEIKNCLFTHSGGSGIKLEVYCAHNQIHHNEISHLGGGGISLIGYGPGNRNTNHDNVISHNHIHHSSLLWWPQGGILLCQSSSNRVYNNLIHHFPYTGIILVGGRSGLFRKEKASFIGNGIDYVNWEQIPEAADEWYFRVGYVHTRHNRIEHNEIHHVMEELGDGNGIYVSGAGVGNVLRRNYIHDLVKKGCQSALRFDDAQWYNLAVENVIWNIHGGGITLKHINDVENNIVVNCKKLAGIWIRGNGERYGSNVRRNIFVQYLDQMVEEGDIHPFYEANRNDKTLFKQPMIDNNVLYCPDHPRVANESLAEMQKLGNAKYSIVGNPLFVNMDTGDFRLSENSPALKLGIKSIDQWGLVEPVGKESKVFIQ